MQQKQRLPEQVKTLTTQPSGLLVKLLNFYLPVVSANFRHIGILVDYMIFKLKKEKLTQLLSSFNV